MISVLIPTYNYDIFPLVSILSKQLEKENINFEIICLDDASEFFHIENQKINDLKNCSYSILEQNIGRSSIRNLLAKNANYDNLLFLDADVIPIHENFISKYISHINNDEKVIYGGVQYQKEKPEKNQILRWIYGNSREVLSVEKRNLNVYLSLLTMHFLTKKSVFDKLTFNESLTKYGHEDTLFSADLKKLNIPVLHIENPICHLGLETSDAFLRKSEEALHGLKFLISNNLIDPEYTRISKIAFQLQKYRLKNLFILIFKSVKKPFLKNLKSENPSLFIFDMYRLGVFLTIKER